MENIKKVNAIVIEEKIAISSANAEYLLRNKENNSGLNEESAKANYYGAIKESCDADNELRDKNITILFALLNIE